MGWFDKLRGMMMPVSEGGSLAGRTVLVADASVAIQKVASLTLGEQGCNVLVVGDGDAAVAELGGRHVDVVVAATALPRRTGYDLCDWLKSRPESSRSRVILLKQLGERLDERRRATGGWDDVLDKPFLPPQLVTVVSGLVTEATSLGEPRRGPTRG